MLRSQSICLLEREKVGRLNVGRNFYITCIDVIISQHYYIINFVFDMKFLCIFKGLRMHYEIGIIFGNEQQVKCGNSYRAPYINQGQYAQSEVCYERAVFV